MLMKSEDFQHRSRDYISFRAGSPAGSRYPMGQGSLSSVTNAPIAAVAVLEWMHPPRSYSFQSCAEYFKCSESHFGWAQHDEEWSIKLLIGDSREHCNQSCCTSDQLHLKLSITAWTDDRFRVSAISITHKCGFRPVELSGPGWKELRNLSGDELALLASFAGS